MSVQVGAAPAPAWEPSAAAVGWTPSAAAVGPGPQALAQEGPVLLSWLVDGPSLDAHRARFGPVPTRPLGQLIEFAASVDLRGRGGAGFPLTRKLRTVAAGRRQPVVVVNLAEGEPGSAKDTTLAQVAPHRILDGAAVAAHALGAREAHLVLADDRPGLSSAMARAVAERGRAGERIRWRTRQTQSGFVAGQARAVLELLAGRENLPVTAWQPEAVQGHRGRPTLLANAETFAHLWALARLGAHEYAAQGLPPEAGTTLLTLSRQDQPDLVIETALGTPWARVLTATQLAAPILLGGHAGCWVPAGGLVDATVSPAGLAERGWTLGAGVVSPLPEGVCPVRRASQIATYLAEQSAGRCGPCRFGLPGLAQALCEVADGATEIATRRVREMVALVDGRGACSHPDGAARMVRSLLLACPDEVAAHERGRCSA